MSPLAVQSGMGICKRSLGDFNSATKVENYCSKSIKNIKNIKSYLYLFEDSIK